MYSGEAMKQLLKDQSFSNRYLNILRDCVIGREVKDRGLEVIKSIPLSICIPKVKYSYLEDLEGSTTHPNQALSALVKNVHPVEDLGGAMLGHEGVGGPMKAILEVFLPTTAMQGARGPTLGMLEIGGHMLIL